MKNKYLNILKNKNYFSLFIADIVSRFGDSIDSIVMTMIVYAITQSASWSALIFAVNRLPTIFVQPFAGTYVEKRNKKIIMIICDILRAILVGIIATKLMFETLTRWDLLIITLLISFVEAFRQPASMSVLPLILDQEQLEVGISLSQSVTQISELIGLGLAGVLIALLGNHAVIYIDMFTFLLSALAISTMTIQKIVNVSKENHFIQEFKDGIAIVSKQPTIRVLLLLAIFLNGIITPFNSLQAPLVKEVLHSSSIMLSIISTSLTLGMIIGALTYPIIKEKINIKTIIILAAYSLSISYIGSCLSGALIQNEIILDLIIALLFFATGIGIAMLNMFARVELMKIVPNDYLSRVMALVTSLCVCMMPVVSFLLSGLTYYFDTFTIFIVVGIINAIIFTLGFKSKLNKLQQY